MRPFAVFDIDGTIIRWQLYHAVADALAKQGHIDKTAFNQVRQSRMNWKRRTGEDSFREYEAELVQVFDASIKGIKQRDFEHAAEYVFGEYRDQVYTYTRDLIRELKSKNYLLFAISGSPSVIVAKLAEYYGFDDYRATEYEIQDGRFTGQMDLSLGRKPERLKDLIAKHSTSLSQSVGIGDSEGDITMLELVEKPVAFNPSKKLLTHAQHKGWQIVVERKNVIYNLESENGKYILA